MNTTEFGNKYLIRNMVFWMGLAFTCLSIALPFARHLIYLLPVLVVLTILGDRGLRLGDEAKPFLALILAGLVLSPLATDEGLKDLYFTFTGVSISFLVKVPNMRLWRLFGLLMICMSIYFLLFGDFRSQINFNVSKSSSPFESSFSFLFGLLSLFALAEKKYRLFFLCLLMTIVSLKRIAVLATIGCAVVFFLGERRARLILNPAAMIAINVLLLLALLLYGYGTLDHLVLEFTGESANEFGQGRRALLSLPAHEVFAHPGNFVFFGQGPGSTYTLANKAVGLYGTAQRMHSDILKIFYEYGFVFFCIFIGLMYSAKEFNTRLAFLYMNIMFLTDNTLIYSFMLFLFVYLTRHVSQQVAPSSKEIACANISN